jgi:hypothetical protein
MNLLRRLRCWLFGHKWHEGPAVGLHQGKMAAGKGVCEKCYHLRVFEEYAPYEN